MIKFKYTLRDDLIQLVHGTISGFYGNYLEGYLPEDLAHDLKHCSLYMVCELSGKLNRSNTYTKPIAIVARNDVDALNSYHTITESSNGTVYAELENRCDKLEVEPL